MGLSGLEIFKHLPKKNCGECGVPTCLAFAMNLASGKASLDDCPYVSDEAKEILGAASRPPIALVKAGTGEKEVEMGDETELFRHDKKYYHETAVAVRVDDTLSETEILSKVKEINNLVFHRVGLEYDVQFVSICNSSGDADTFADCVSKVFKSSELPLLLETESPEAVEKVISEIASTKPVICGANAGNYEKMASLAKDAECPLVVKGSSLEELASLVEKITDLGHEQLILDSGSRNMSQVVADMTQIRRLAIKEKFQPFGFPTIAFTSGGDPLFEVVEATNYVSKYASLVIMDASKKEHILPLLTWRQNLYTDPQVPIQVQEELNEIGEVNEKSPLYVTTNFSLTYYLVEAEVENSRVPGYILPVNTDGTSVLTAYAAGKFEPETIVEAFEKHSIKEKLENPTIVIPGYVAVLYAKLKELTGWNIVVGPQEATAIPGFAKNNFQEGA